MHPTVLHKRASVDVVVVEHVADFVVATVGHRDVAVPVAEVVAVAVVVVAFLELVGGVLEVVGGGGEVERWVRIRPELCPLSCPPHHLEHLVPVHVTHHCHLLHLKLHLHRVDP